MSADTNLQRELCDLFPMSIHDAARPATIVIEGTKGATTIAGHAIAAWIVSADVEYDPTLSRMQKFGERRFLVLEMIPQDGVFCTETREVDDDS